jgi:uncharacterized protein (DUF1778 family)
MPRQPNPRPVGRPKLPKGEAKAAPIQIRLNPESRKRVEQAAKAKGVKMSERIRATIEANA